MRLVVIELGATLAAAIVSQGATFVHDRALVFEAASAACLGLAIATQLLSRRAGWNQDWYADRAIAETSVSASWRYVARIAPFDGHEATDESFASLLMADIPRGSHLLSSQIASLGQGAFEPTAAIRRLRAADWQERAQRYAEQRLRDQRVWYETKARANGRRERLFAMATLSANLCSVVFVAFRLIDTSYNMVSVFTTLAAALLAWSSTRRFHELGESYTAVGGELRDIEALLLQAEEEDDFRECAAAAEDAISAEHAVWIVRRLARHPTSARRAIRRV